MPKVVLAKWRNREEMTYLSERTKMYNEELKKSIGKDVVKRNEIAAFLGCSTKTVSRYLEGVKKVGGTRGTYHAIDVARRLAEREVGVS